MSCDFHKPVQLHHSIQPNVYFQESKDFLNASSFEALIAYASELQLDSKTCFECKSRESAVLSV